MAHSTIVMLGYDELRPLMGVEESPFRASLRLTCTAVRHRARAYAVK